MIYLIFIVIALILAFLIIIGYFFIFAFVRLNTGDLDDMNSPVNLPLKEHHKIIAEGIDFINSKEPKWVETLSFDGLKLKARYFNNNSDKTVLLFHGYRSSAARDFSCAVKMYLNFGFNILLVDQRSHGFSEGRLITFGIKERRDVVSWVEFLNEQFSPKKIIISGMSMGATTVLLASELELAKNVVGVIADCGFTSPVDIIKVVGKKAFKINPSFFIPFLNICCLIFGGFSLYCANTCEAVKKSKLPILFIHGKSDNFVPCEMSERAYKSREKNSEIFLVENAEHGLSFLVDTEGTIRKLEAFLKKCIQ